LRGNIATILSGRRGVHQGGVKLLANKGGGGEDYCVRKKKRRGKSEGKAVICGKDGSKT